VTRTSDSASSLGLIVSIGHCGQHCVANLDFLGQMFRGTAPR
jgi:hypothetical protein